jgi:hypothetical protein
LDELHQELCTQIADAQRRYQGPADTHRTRHRSSRSEPESMLRRSISARPDPPGSLPKNSSDLSKSSEKPAHTPLYSDSPRPCERSTPLSHYKQVREEMKTRRRLLTHLMDHTHRQSPRLARILPIHLNLHQLSPISHPCSSDHSPIQDALVSKCPYSCSIRVVGRGIHEYSVYCVRMAVRVR